MGSDSSRTCRSDHPSSAAPRPSTAPRPSAADLSSGRVPEPARPEQPAQAVSSQRQDSQPPDAQHSGDEADPAQLGHAQGQEQQPLQQHQPAAHQQPWQQPGFGGQGFVHPQQLAMMRQMQMVQQMQMMHQMQMRMQMGGRGMHAGGRQPFWNGMGAHQQQQQQARPPQQQQQHQRTLQGQQVRALFPRAACKLGPACRALVVLDRLASSGVWHGLWGRPCVPSEEDHRSPAAAPLPVLLPLLRQCSGGRSQCRHGKPLDAPGDREAPLKQALSSRLTGHAYALWHPPPTHRLTGSAGAWEPTADTQADACLLLAGHALLSLLACSLS